MKAEVFAMLTSFEREAYAKGLEAMGYEVVLNAGYHDLEFIDGLTKPGKVWGDRTMTVQQWPTAQVGHEVVEDGKTYLVKENVWLDGPASHYAVRWSLYARVRFDWPNN
jgi:hypothetical protein